MNLKRPSAAWRSSLVVAACGLVLAVAWAAPSDSTRAAAQTRVGCISTPDEYLIAWNNRQVRCVSPFLFGTTHERGSATIYPSGFWYAYAGSNTNLERYLVLRRIYGDNPPKVGIGILSYVGFPDLESYDVPTDLAVYTLPQGTQVQVPSFETWFRILDEEFGNTGAYPLAAQIDLVLAYSRLRPNEDVVGAFQTVTGCRRAAMRGVLYQCQDVGFLNTGVGLGYNTYANPFVCEPAAKQTVRQRYTGREFIFPNMAFNDLPSHVNIELDLGEPFTRGFLYSGYCRISDRGGTSTGSTPASSASVQNNAQDLSIGRTLGEHRSSRRSAIDRNDL